MTVYIHFLRCQTDVAKNVTCCNNRCNDAQNETGNSLALGSTGSSADRHASRTEADRSDSQAQRDNIRNHNSFKAFPCIGQRQAAQNDHIDKHGTDQRNQTASQRTTANTALRLRRIARSLVAVAIRSLVVTVLILVVLRLVVLILVIVIVLILVVIHNSSSFPIITQHRHRRHYNFNKYMIALKICQYIYEQNSTFL